MIRPLSQRILDTLEALDRQSECWISVSRANGSSHMIPVSYVWDGERIVLATAENSVTVRSVNRSGRMRFSLPSTQDVVIIDASAMVVPLQKIDVTTHSLFRQTAGFDPERMKRPSVYILLTPERVHAWRTERELPGREIMTAGIWRSD